jgi:hypothetical protein
VVVDPPPTPEELAQRALLAMQLKRINIGIAPKPGPNSMGLIGMPTWMWVANPTAQTFGPIERSITDVITVTARAEVERVVWNMGDGNTVTCTGPGTPYHESYGKRRSPDCGHAYTRTSANQPNKAYTVSATAYWVLRWTGPGGTSGTIQTDFSNQAQIQVGEMQVIITR